MNFICFFIVFLLPLPVFQADFFLLITEWSQLFTELYVGSGGEWIRAAHSSYLNFRFQAHLPKSVLTSAQGPYFSLFLTFGVPRGSQCKKSPSFPFLVLLAL